ncbi:MAG: DEAD/DEAH box helicase, partial [Desulfobulbaceae bacterium]|nr:DEAD/DEAH box helicase [Desulfobulbaceae bacterium]HIJ78038.1 DEAD/DEAH box helicase [Deltaproteobacteria bacterium]
VSPVYGEPTSAWSDLLVAGLNSLGVEKLYAHQARAIDLVRQGGNVVVATPTASGKSLIYNLPVFEAILGDSRVKALYLFPLKALAQDQLRAVEELAAKLPSEHQPRAAICDGDTSAYRRKKLREAPPNILISNPDMLHLSMMGYHESWAEFWADLKYVIIDEAHTYRGVFGSHMAWVMRRLKRICNFYGSKPSFILSSATIGNPGELARDLIGLDVEVVSDSGAPQGPRHFLFVDPLDSAAYTASQLLEAAIKRGLRTIVYTQSRKMTELISVWTSDRLGGLADKLTSYRAGYLPEERREIEEKLTSGALYGVVATSALELGIDIGALDICILVGYPGTVMQTWQRSGRVGRKLRESLTILVGQEDALDQFFMRNPEEFFKREVEKAVLNPENPVILDRHLLCGVAERPLRHDDPLLLEKGVVEAVARLTASGELLQGADGKNWFTNRKYPHREVDLRGSGQSFAIYDASREELLGRIDGVRCLKECHPGAIYLHRGQTWLVVDLDLAGHSVMVQRKKVNYFTRPLATKETEILEVCATVEFANFKASWGRLKVTDLVTAYQRRLVKGQKLVATERLDLPPQVFETEGLWLEIPLPLQQRLEQEQVHFMGGIHAVEHGAIGIFPLVVLCDRNDVGGIAYPFHPQVGRAAIFIYDGYAGGVGLSRQAFGELAELLRLTLQTIASCPCEVGCPSCVHSPKCGSGNRPIDKAAALRLLQALLGQQEAGAVCQPQVRAATILAGGAEEAGGDAQALPAASDVARPLRFGVFDLETKRSAAEVGGWHRAEKMGISVGVLYDSASDSYLSFFEDRIEQLVEHLKGLDLVIGFNNKRFDNLVLSAYTDEDLSRLPTLDILQVVRDRLGYRLSLDHLAEHTLGVKKSANGLQALEWYQAGEIDKIVEYCQKDVQITRDLYLFGLKEQHLLFRNKAGMLVRCPVVFAKGKK